MVMKKYLWSLSLRKGAALIGIICVLYYGAVGAFLAFRFFGDGPQYGSATSNTALNYGQITAFILLVISGILLTIGACGDRPGMALMFLICGGVYTVWCAYMMFYVIEYVYKAGWILEVGYNVIFEFLFMCHSWLAVLSYVIDEDMY